MFGATRMGVGSILNAAFQNAGNAAASAFGRASEAVQYGAFAAKYYGSTGFQAARDVAADVKFWTQDLESMAQGAHFGMEAGAAAARNMHAAAKAGSRTWGHRAGAGNIGAIGKDLSNLREMGLDGFAGHLNRDSVANWFNTRIFGKATRNTPEGQMDFGDVTFGRGGFGGETTYSFQANTGFMNEMRKVAGAGVKPAVVGTGLYMGASALDSAAGYMYGGPDYGGFIGFGEGAHNIPNAMQGAVTNTNYQGQMMGMQALNSNQVAAQYSLTVAPMRQRRATASLRNSTNGLALGLHRGRHGGY